MHICKRTGLVILSTGLAFSLVGCLSSSGDSDHTTTESSTYTVDGTVSGLGPGELTLEFNGEEVLVTENGDVSFDEQITEDNHFSISVIEAPSNPLQECTALPASGTVTSDMTVNVVCTTPIELTGKLTAPEAEGNQVTLTVGDHTFSNTADSDGIYTIQADLDDPWAIMRLDAGEDNWHFRSHIGSMVGLSEQSSIPTEAERNQLKETITGRINLNHLNTALNGQMEWLHGESEFSDHDALTAAGRDLLTQQAAEVAGALRMVTEGIVGLPDWADNTHKVAVDHPAARAWIQELKDDEQTSENLYEQDTTSSLDHSASVRSGSSTQELDAQTQAAVAEATVESDGYTELPESLFVSVGHEFGIVTYGAKLDLLSNQVWMRETTGARANGPFDFSGGRLHMNFEDYDEPYFSREYVCFDEDGEESADCTDEYYYQDVVVERVMDGLTGDVVTQKVTTRIKRAGDYADPSETTVRHRLVSLMAPGDNIPLEVESLPGEIALTFPPDAFEEEADDQSEYFFEQDMTRMADIVSLEAGGTGSLQAYDLPIYWDVRSNGQLEIRIDGQDEIFQFWMLSGATDGEGHLFVDSTHSNQAGIRSDIGLRKDGDIFFNTAALEGRWELWAAENRDSEAFGFDYDPANNPDVIYIGALEPRQDIPDHEFDLVENQPHLLTFNGAPRSPVFVSAKCQYLEEDGSFSEIVPAPSIGLPEDPDHPECNRQYRERTWQIIRQDGDRLYMTEKQRWYFSLERDDGDGGTERHWHRAMETDSIRYWDRIGDSEI